MICSDCGKEKGEHILCKKCMQEIIDKCNKQGALEELKLIRNNLLVAKDYQSKRYIENRIKELSEKKV